MKNASMFQGIKELSDGKNSFRVEEGRKVFHLRNGAYVFVGTIPKQKTNQAIFNEAITLI